VAHTATYVRGGESLQVAPVVVTSYERAAGLTETVRQRLRNMDGYALDVAEIGGDNVWRMKGAAGDQWMVWVSNSQLVKVGAPDGASEVPAVIVEKYLDVYPSDLDDKGKAKQGRASAGAATTSSSGQDATSKTEEGASR
jgi:hypothetical protein